jgi:hypothetical protein
MEKITIKNGDGSLQSSGEQKGSFNFQLINIFETALKRSSEAIQFFEKKGAASQNILNRAFFLYLGVKKDAQRMILEKIAVSLGIEVSVFREEENADNAVELYQEAYENIFDIVHEIAGDELEFYLNYAAIEDDPRIRSFILMLADFSKEFLFDVKIWYLNHKDAGIVEYSEFPRSPFPDYEVVSFPE